MVEISLGLRSEPHSTASDSPSGPRSSQATLTSYLQSPESGELTPRERRELRSLTREQDGELFHTGLLHLAQRIENGDRIGLASRLYTLVQSRSESPALRQRAESRLALFEGGGGTGDRVEFLARRFVSQATEPSSLLAMGLGGAAFRVARLGLLGRLLANPASSWATRGFGARALASTGAFLAESTAFTFTGRAWLALNGTPQDWGFRSLGREWTSSALTLGALRGFGALGGGLYRRVHGARATPWQGLYGQSAMLGGILSAHYVEGRLGLREEVHGAHALVEGFVTLLQFNIAGRLSREAFGHRWQSWERGLDQRAERLRWAPPPTGGAGWGLGALGPRWAGAVAGRPANPATENFALMEGSRSGDRAKPPAKVPSNGTGERLETPPAEAAEATPSDPADKLPSWWPAGEILPDTLRDFIDSLPDTTVIFEFVPGEASEGLVGRILMANRKVEEKFGFSQEEVVGMPLSRFTRPSDAPEFSRMQQHILHSNRIKFKEVRFVRRTGEELYCDVSGVVRRAGERTIGFAILQDVSLRRRSQALIQAEKIRFQALLRGMPDVMFRISGEGEFLDAHAEQPENFIVPPSMAVGMKIRELPLPAELTELGMSTLEAALRTRETQIVSYPLPMQDGTVRHQEVRMTASGDNEVVATIRDVTEARQAEVHRIAAARAETFKLIGRGLAHDANNALVPLLLSIEHALKVTERGAVSGKGLTLVELAGLTENLQTASEVADRIKGMIASFRELSIEPEAGPPFDMHSLLRASDIQALLGSHSQLRIRLSAESWLVPGPRENIHRVVQNLVVNARDAMEGRQGLLRVETDKVVLSEEDLRQLSSLSPQILNQRGGNFMRLRVQDNGEGVPHEIQRRIFDPYFSTKSKSDAAGHGGLGLALTQKLVQDAGGFITVESSLGMGTTFDVYLPNVDALASLESKRQMQEIHNLSLLVVSPDPAQRETFLAGLSERGFSQVLSAQSFEQAVELSRGRPQLGALITEYRLPENKFGIHLLRQLRAQHPGLPVLLWSEHDPVHFSGMLAPYGTVVDRGAAPSQVAGILEDLMLRRLNDRE